MKKYPVSAQRNYVNEIICLIEKVLFTAATIAIFLSACLVCN